MLFKRVEEGRPYPDHGLTAQDWAQIPPTRVRLSTLVTTKRYLDLALIMDDATFFGDIFAHVVEWRGELYLEDGMHRALRAALSSRGDALLHARVYEMDAPPGAGQRRSITDD
ncbi:MAG: type II toxin-antitoxin system VapB family antitoxin [Candidatus Nanopelagicales bacterium]